MRTGPSPTLESGHQTLSFTVWSIWTDYNKSILDTLTVTHQAALCVYDGSSGVELTCLPTAQLVICVYIVPTKSNNAID